MFRVRAIGIALILFAVGGIIDRTWISPTQDSGELCGWNEQLARTESPRIAAQMPKFAITDDDGTPITGAGKSAELWKFARAANNGKHIPTWKQESGDCVSMGASNAEAYRQAFQIINDGRPEQLKILFPPYTYGGSRVIIGRSQLGNKPGSVGAWAAQFAQSHGVYTLEQAAKDGYAYSGQLANNWGQVGPPKETITFGRQFRIRSVAQVKSWEDVRDALVHGYPVTVASNVGFKGQSYTRDGKLWLTQAGNWGHQMCFIGVEDRPGKIKGAYIINSWGEDAHPRPLNDEPPGGFWAPKSSVSQMVSQGDSWAYSDFDGFPGRLIADWNMFKRRPKTVNSPDTTNLVAAADAPVKKPLLLEQRQMFSLYVLWTLLAVGTLTLLMTFRLSRKTSTAIAILCIVSVTSAAMTAPTSAEASRRSERMSRRSSKMVDAPEVTDKVTPKAPEPIQLASNEPVPVAVWNALESRRAVQQVTQQIDRPIRTYSSATHAWNAMAKSKKLRTYADCYASEPEFTLLVGDQSRAKQLMKSGVSPLAYERDLRPLTPGQYKVFELPNKGKCIQRVSSPQ